MGCFYGLNSSHWVSSIQIQSLLFDIVLAADVTKEGRALFTKFTNCKQVLSGVKELYHHIQASGDTSVVHGYMIHSHTFASTALTCNFWQLQASIVIQL
mmetsp:Transcript_19068/g.39960  ORF Transcript_19068/g.39960 Transcript_19068/m.39960 type:complete len:99 (-) Transcript_19068:178-474(-)